ncbi:MAG: four-carbon acid sugar kinase family protein, partial [Acidobacteria bacterium]|nr:four-carbon acid sugar kinase family protein [Acidobacteriota bacterium]
MDSPSIFAIADDLTGALETGSKFAAMSLDTRVSTKLVGGPEAISVFDTETRHLSGPEAASRIETLARDIRHDLIYKKTDSTLRGNIGAELGALARVFPERRIVFVPAYPALGRIVRNGELLVDGVPVHETPIGQDKLNPLRSSSIRACLGDVDATVIDGETDADILVAARQIVEDKRPVIVAGPAAIAGALAAQYSQVPTRLAIPSHMRCLVINGSLHPASAGQLSNHRFEENWFR